MRRFSCLHMIATWPWLELPLRIAQISLLFGLVTPSPAQVLSPLYNFNGKNTSAYPVYGAPAQGRDGKMYGTASGATNTKGGAVFALTIKGVATFPHTFSSDTGSDPFGGVILAADGAMYGTTGFGGSADSGVLFRIGSDRVYSILHEFQGGRKPIRDRLSGRGKQLRNGIQAQYVGDAAMVL